ncbi:MAG: hypothetical protein EBT22_06900 [Chloroflexi bacterium]|nr:hypothetical protein [Chloroflexota bacterium]
MTVSEPLNPGERLEDAHGSLHWSPELVRASVRVADIVARYRTPQVLTRRDGEKALAEVRARVGPRLRDAVSIVDRFCPTGYPVFEDNGIPGPGGAVGVRLSAWHSLFFALEGGPLPPPDMNAPVTLVCLTLRYDPDRGWVELRRRLDPRWDDDLIDDHVVPCLVGFAHDAMARHVAGRDGTR